MALTCAEGKSSDFIEAEGGDRGDNAQVYSTVAHFFNVLQRGGDLVVVGVQLPEG